MKLARVTYFLPLLGFAVLLLTTAKVPVRDLKSVGGPSYKQALHPIQVLENRSTPSRFQASRLRVLPARMPGTCI
jgi:hypothetical protein